MDFTHLKVATSHSLQKSIINVDDLLGKTKENGQTAIAVSDINNLFNVVSFYQDSMKAGIKPIVSSTLYMYEDEKEEKESRSEISFYAKNEKGFENLNKLLSRAWLDNNKSEYSGISKTWLTKENLEGLIVLSGAKNGKIGKHILSNNMGAAEEETIFWKKLVGDNFFMELQRDGSIDESAYMQGALELCQRCAVAPVATHPVYFLDPSEFVVHEIKTCINSGDTLYDRKRVHNFNKDMYLKTSAEMVELFKDVPQAIENTNLIAKMCNFQMKLGGAFLPEFPVPNDMTPAQYLRHTAQEGLEERLEYLYPDKKERDEKRPEYQARLDVELGVISKMNFDGYFLIVSDFIRFSRDNKIAVGAGRGSGAGSLVAYSLKITELDPLKYGLLFERFLNPERISMPDFDIDFCPERRGEVIQYVKAKYGSDKVSQISTFSKLAPRAAVKDAARVLNYHYGVGDAITKLINIKPPESDAGVNLNVYLFGNTKMGRKPDEKLLDLYNNEREVKQILDVALKLEGLPRQVGMHAGGVIISPEPITKYSPLYKKDSGGEVVCQFDKVDIEKAGLIKFDFLGLSTLTVIQKCTDLINKNREAEGLEPIDLNKIRTDDPAIFAKIFAPGNTKEVFQFESAGMRSLFKQINPDKFEDLIALNALYRPGPMDIINDWVEARQQAPEERVYPHPLLKGILEETYGFMIYQEQVMQCAQIIAGYSLGGADILRRAMGKKDIEEMKKQRAVFIEGASRNGIDEKTSNHLFNLIDKFSGYGFNKSHAAAYSFIAYQTAYLKYNYTAEYFYAALNNNITDTDKIDELVVDARLNELKVLPPDVNKSTSQFSIESNEAIRYGFSALKGVGDSSSQIEKIRAEQGEFTDIYDFLEKMPKGTLNKKILEQLIKVGGFDSLYPNRAELLENLKELLDYNKKFNEKKIEEQQSMLCKEIPGFDDTSKKKKKSKPVERPVLKAADPWSEKQILAFEKEATGFYLTGNPVLSYEKELGGFPAADKMDDLEYGFKENGKTNGLVYGLISEIRPYKSKTGAFVKVTNGGKTIDFLTKNDILNKNKDLFKEDTFVALHVSMFESDEGEIKYMAKEAFSFEDCQKKTVDKIFIGSEEAKLSEFEQICQNHPGNTRISFCVERVAGGRKDNVISKQDVEFSPKLISELKQSFGENWVKMTFVDKVNVFSLNNNTNKYKKRP